MTPLSTIINRRAREALFTHGTAPRIPGGQRKLAGPGTYLFYRWGTRQPGVWLGPVWPRATHHHRHQLCCKRDLSRVGIAVGSSEPQRLIHEKHVPLKALTPMGLKAIARVSKDAARKFLLGGTHRGVHRGKSD